MTTLQVYHTLAVGGVASYLLNLGARLVARGHRVLVAAPPGELAPKLAPSGIIWYPVRISDWRLLQARRQLASLIRDEGVDLICGHDYTAGAAAYLAARRAAVPYLLTVHCRRPAWQRLVVFYWSQPVVTVSPGLRQSLIRELGLAPGRVVESFVGVDPVRFASRPAAPRLAAELGIRPDTPVVLHVSRFSPTKSPVALALVEAAERLVAAHPGLVILLVGAGEDEDTVRRAAERTNLRIGRAAVRTLGARTDVPDLMRLARVVVGTGTVALEAMASGRPVVAAGKSGFVGSVTPQSFEAARETFFGDHGRPARTGAAALAVAVTELLGDGRRCDALAAWGRQTVVERFTLERMTDHVESIYAGLGRAETVRDEGEHHLVAGQQNGKRE
jgi:glycosyltransferase involved in cell wall biosynthesis